MCTSDFIRILLQSARDPVRQLSGFLLTEDPTYLPVGPARVLSRQICRDELLEEIVEVYITNKFQGYVSGGGQVRETSFPVTGCKNARWRDHSDTSQAGSLLP